MDSTLAVQQWIQQTINRDPSNITAILTPPETQDEEVWKYEHLRQFCMELNGLAVKLQAECFPETCNQMTATEQWIFLCAAHKSPKECPAIDYTRHTLDGAACLLNSNKYFPSRLVKGGILVEDFKYLKLRIFYVAGFLSGSHRWENWAPFADECIGYFPMLTFIIRPCLTILRRNLIYARGLHALL